MYAILLSLSPCGKSGEILADSLEYFSGIVHQIHLVDRYHQMRDADQAGEVGMAARLGKHALARVDQNNGKIGRGSARNHIARVLLVARCVGNDEFALGRRKVTISHINGNALLTLRLQAVGKQR